MASFYRVGEKNCHSEWNIGEKNNWELSTDPYMTIKPWILKSISPLPPSESAHFFSVDQRWTPPPFLLLAGQPFSTNHNTIRQLGVTSVGIQKHFMEAEIPGFGLLTLFFGLTMSCFLRDGIVNWFTIKLNNLDLIIVLFLRIEPNASECQSGLLTPKLPRQYK